MIRVLVMAARSLLADAVALHLAENSDLNVVRVTRRNRTKIAQGERESFAVVIVIEDINVRDAFATANSLIEDYDCLRIIILSPHRHNLHIWDMYQLPSYGMAKVFDRLQDARTETYSEAAS